MWKKLSSSILLIPSISLACCWWVENPVLSPSIRVLYPEKGFSSVELVKEERENTRIFYWFNIRQICNNPLNYRQSNEMVIGLYFRDINRAGPAVFKMKMGKDLINPLDRNFHLEIEKIRVFFCPYTSSNSLDYEFFHLNKEYGEKGIELNKKAIYSLRSFLRIPPTTKNLKILLYCELKPSEKFIRGGFYRTNLDAYLELLPLFRGNPVSSK
jgi:hypothetical protein